MRPYILIVEDESDIGESLRYNFERERFRLIQLKKFIVWKFK